MKRLRDFSFMMLVILIKKGKSPTRPAPGNYGKTDSRYTDTMKFFLCEL